MPNHVTNEIRIIGPEARVAEFFEQAKQPDSEFSFKGFVPPPDHPDYSAGGCGHSHPGKMLMLTGQVKELPQDPHKNCWYMWNPQNWGTKWDAYSVEIDGNHTILDRLARAHVETIEGAVRFDTAWSPPFPVFNKLVELFPDCRFEFRWLDEDMTGSGGGTVEGRGGELVNMVNGINDPENPLTGQKWWELARDLKGYDKEQHDEYLADVAEDERLTAEAEAEMS